MSEISKKRESEETWKGMLKKSRAEENLISFSKPPTLQDITLVSIATRLWTNFSSAENLNNPTYEHGCVENGLSLKYFHELEKIVLNQPVEGFLAHSLKLELRNFIRPIGVQLSSWYESNDREYCSLKDLRDIGCSLYWTTEGTIDKVKSLKDFFKQVKLGKVNKSDIHTFYELACKYCIEEYISYFWNEIPSNERRKHDGVCGVFNHFDIIVYWTLVQKNNLPGISKVFNFASYADRNASIYQNMISWSVYAGNPFALKYFWQKVTDSEINAFLEKWLKAIVIRVESTSASYKYLEYNSFAYIMCFLFSQLRDKEKQKKFVHNHSYLLLTTLFRSWPFSQLYLPSVLAVLSVPEENVCVSIMTNVVNRTGREGNNQQVFGAIWNASPQKLKILFLKGVDQDCHPRVLKTLMKLVHANEIHTVVTVLNYMTSEQKDCIVFGLISDLILRDDYETLQTLLEKTFGCENDMQSIKENNLDPLKICISLTFSDYDTIQTFLRWYFKTSREIREFEESFFCEESSKYLKTILLRCASSYDAWSSFEKFRSLCLCAEEDSEKFKKLCLNAINSVVENCYFKFASRLLGWCLDTSLEIEKFKADLLLSDCGIKNISLATHSGWDKVSNLIEWASPLSRELVSVLKLLLSGDEKYEWVTRRRKRAFKLLDACAKIDFKTWRPKS